MKNIIYILLFIWNIGIGQRDELTDLKIALGGTANNVEGIDTTFTPFKYDTILVEELPYKGQIKIENGGKVELSDSVVYDTGATINLSDFPGYSMTVFINGISDTASLIYLYQDPPLKYDTVKAVFLISDTAIYTFEIDNTVPSITLEFREKEIYTRQDKSNWRYGYVIIQSEYGEVKCEMKQCLHAAYHYGYGNKKPIGYLDLSKQPFSKDIIIWDYKIVE